MFAHKAKNGSSLFSSVKFTISDVQGTQIWALNEYSTNGLIVFVQYFTYGNYILFFYWEVLYVTLFYHAVSNGVIEKGDP